MMDIRQGIIDAANALGVSPIDLATAMSFETGGTFDPMQSGPYTKWGRHRGFIQFGEPQTAAYGIDFSSPQAAIDTQLGSNGGVVKYLRASGVQPGMGLPDIYSAINAGGVGRGGAMDMGTSVDQKVEMMGPHQKKAASLLGGQFTPTMAATTAVAPRPISPGFDFDVDEGDSSSLADAFTPRTGPRSMLSEEPDLKAEHEAPLPSFDFGGPESDAPVAPAPAAEIPSLAAAPTPLPLTTLASLFKVPEIGGAAEKDLPYDQRARRSKLPTQGYG
jgi:hypothetical protein